jgi:hypothetical protein
VEVEDSRASLRMSPFLQKVYPILYQVDSLLDELHDLVVSDQFPAMDGQMWKMRYKMQEICRLIADACDSLRIWKVPG